MKILIYSSRKDRQMWDISTPLKRKAAFLELFRYLRDTWQVYVTGDMEGHEIMLFKKANTGDPKAAEALLTLRVQQEYEEWEEGELRIPNVRGIKSKTKGKKRVNPTAKS